MTPEFIIIRFYEPGKGERTLLIRAEEYRDHIKDGDHEKGDFSYYLSPRVSMIREVGRIQILGDIDELDDQYLSD